MENVVGLNNIEDEYPEQFISLIALVTSLFYGTYLSLYFLIYNTRLIKMFIERNKNNC